MVELEAPAGDAAPLVRAGLRSFLDLDRLDILCVILLTLGAFVIRFASPIYPDFLSHPLGGAPVRMSGVGHPYNADPKACADVPDGISGPTVNRCGFVFDEVYFPVDAAKDLHQPPVSYFDPEPPLAKALMVPPIAILGFNTWSWRFSTTVAGSLFVGLIYLIARRLRRDRFFAIVAAGLVALDGLALVEARIGVIDMIAICLVAATYYAFLLHWQARTRTQWRTTLYVLAAVAGLALGAKLTALAPIAVAATLITVRWLHPLLLRVRGAGRLLSPTGAVETELWRSAGGRVPWLHHAAALAVVALVFAACFSRYLTIEHADVYRFTNCSISGGLTAPTPAVMPAATAQVGGARLPVVGAVPRVTVLNPVQGVRNILEKTAADLQYHQTECHSHPYSSRWYSWPVMYHPVLFYYNDKVATPPAGPVVESITDMGNPALWWLGIPALLLCLWRATRGPAPWRLFVALLGLSSLAAMILLFHAAERPESETVRVAPGPLFVLAFAGMVIFAGLIAVSAVVSRRFVPGFIVLGYVTAWMMWVPGNGSRILFFYHAMGMLIFLALALAYVLTLLRRVSVRMAGRDISMAPAVHGALGAVVAAFVFFYPVWTAVPLDSVDHAMRTWVDTW
ncbi:MAG: phospholipid carrier-dependent glycosyltransferase [Candidatus Dormibacteria bacterium]